ncbi:MAG: hypothetical protein Q9M36_06395 [Sulfurovum sp.]|nr:hypothetical protein [Sulfurovum sp.]
MPSLFSCEFFYIIDSNIEKNWLFIIDDIEYNKEISSDALYFISMTPKEMQYPHFSYEKIFDYEQKNVDIFLEYITNHDLKLVANLAYAPNFRKEYYKELLNKIDKN